MHEKSLVQTPSWLSHGEKVAHFERKTWLKKKNDNISTSRSQDVLPEEEVSLG